MNTIFALMMLAQLEIMITGRDMVDIVGPRWSDTVTVAPFKFTDARRELPNWGYGPAAEFVWTYRYRSVPIPCPDELIGCAVYHAETMRVVGMSKRVAERYETERIEFIKAAFGWRGWEGQRVWDGGHDFIIIDSKMYEPIIPKVGDRAFSAEWWVGPEGNLTITEDFIGSCRCEGNPKP